jgi:hypothetical protein
MHSCNRCTGGSDTPRVRGSDSDEDQEQPREPEDPAGEGDPIDDLPECPDHRPSSFLKDKPRCMLIQLFYIYKS